MDAGQPLAAQRVVLLGFGDFERSALSSYLRLSRARLPGFVQVETLGDADFAIADADHPGALDAIRAARRAQDTVFVGSVAPDGALGWTMRPIDPLQVFRELEAAVAIRHVDVVRPVTDSGSGALDSGSGGLDSAPGVARRAGDSAATPSALLVDDSDIAQRFLQRELHALGLRTECALSSARALELLAQQRFDVVFLDVDLGPASALDGLALCQHLKHPRLGVTAPVPRVVMVSAHHTATDRVRGTFAGCDAYLGKPLDNDELLRVLRRFGLASDADAQRRKGRREGVPTSGPVPLAGPN